MSFKRLVTITESNATRYPLLDSDAPITPRQLSDESDTASNATSISEDTETDDGAEHLLDFNARVLRRRQAQARVQNTLQYARGRIDDGVRPIQELAYGVADNGDFYYNDVARPFFHEAVFRAHVITLTTVRWLLLVFWWIVEVNWWIVWSTLDAIGETLMTVTYMIWVVICFAFDVLCQVVFSIPQLLRDTPWWMLKPIAVAVSIVLVTISVIHGLTSMSMYVCNDAALRQEWSTLPEFCNHTNTAAVLNYENAEVARLVRNSDTVIRSVLDMRKTAKLVPGPGSRLLTESTALVDFTKTHSDSLAAFSVQEDIIEVANAVHSNVTAFNVAVQRFRHNHDIRDEELGIKFQRILSDAERYTPQSPAERFFLESASHYIPSTFSHTGVARQTSHYIDVITQFLESPQTAAILKQGNEASQHMYNAKQGIGLATKTIKRYVPFWQHEAEHSHHPEHSLVNPEHLLKRLANALNKAQDNPAASVKELHTLHRTVKAHLMALRSDLTRLSKAASGQNKKGEGERAATARAILHQFVVRLGELDLFIGEGTYVIGVKLGEGDARGSKYKRLADGRRVPHAEAYE